jgi:flagellar FliL protein
MATASKAAPKNAPAAESAEPKKSKNILFIIVAVVLVLAAGGAGAMYFLTQGKLGAAPLAAAAKPMASKPPVFMSLETFTVNLQFDEAQQFLQANLTLQVGDQSQIDVIKLHMPQVRNRLLLLLSSKKASEILTVEGKKKLASEIIDTMREPFTPDGPKQDVTDVFFTSFVVQ